MTVETAFVRLFSALAVGYVAVVTGTYTLLSRRLRDVTTTVEFRLATGVVLGGALLSAATLVTGVILFLRGIPYASWGFAGAVVGFALTGGGGSFVLVRLIRTQWLDSSASHDAA